MTQTATPAEATATHGCAGHSAFGHCPVGPAYAVDYSRGTQHACGRHLAWLISRVAASGQTVAVTYLPEGA